jgi:hypothetical protein
MKTIKSQAGHFSILILTLLLVIASCHPLDNPVDPEAVNYIGAESVDLDGDGIGSLYDVDDIYLLSPVDGETVDTRTPIFTVFPFDTTTVEQYCIEVSLYNDALFDGFCFFSKDDYESNSCTIPDDIFKDSTFYWRAKAHDGSKWSDNWSEIQNFKIDTGNPLSISPPNDSSTVDMSPLINWEDLPCAAAYQLQVNTASSFDEASMLVNETAIAASQFQITTLINDNTTCYWRTRPVNADGLSGGWSVVHTFDVALLPPSNPSPEDGERIKAATPTLDWEDVAGTAGYHIQLNNSDTFDVGSMVAENTVLSESYYSVVNALTNEQVYYWRIKIQNDNGFWSDWSAPWRFTPEALSFTEHTISDSFDGGWSVYAEDLDSDGDMDILGAAYYADDIMWWENDGSGNFTDHTISSNFDGAYSVYAEDLDKDGDMDVLGAASNANDITWWENNGSETFTEHTINGSFDTVSSVYAEDIDGDGDMDVLGAAIDAAADITWWENDGNEVFIEYTISTNFTGAHSVYAEDLNGDGDMDILGAAYSASDITWWENDGDETFTEHTISANFDGAFSVYSEDLDEDGDMDVLGAAGSANEITWWENDGGGSFTEHTISADYAGAYSVYAEDLNGDGEMDVLGAAQNADDITWWENSGSGNFIEHTISANFDGANSVYAEDIDGDGDMDVIGAAYSADAITWWENDLIP